MSEHTTLIINWKGPYSYDDITNNLELRNGLYLAAGKQNMKEVIIPSNIVALQKENSPQDLGIITNSHLLQENRNFGWEQWLCQQMRAVIILKWLKH